MQEIDPNPLRPDDIASFNATIVTARGIPVGTCLKLRRLDGRDHVLHLRPEQAGRLFKALEEYMEHGNHQGLMLAFHNDPALVEKLAPTHPYNTLLTMSPAFNEGEAGDLRRATDVAESQFAARGAFVTYQAGFSSGDRAEFRLHECVAFNLWGFINKMVSDAGVLYGQAGGNA